MIAACGLGTHTFRVACEDAHGLRAGALIAALGGRCAERRPIVATSTEPFEADACEMTLALLEAPEREAIWAAFVSGDLALSAATDRHQKNCIQAARASILALAIRFAPTELVRDVFDELYGDEPGMLTLIQGGRDA
jgi:hypothetical protein